MRKFFDKKKFIEDLYQFPYWIDDKYDLIKYCKYLKYRLSQEKAITDWYKDNVELSGEKWCEMQEIIEDYDKAFNEDLYAQRLIKEAVEQGEKK